MMFYRRDTHVAEVQMGTPASRLEDACAPDHFDLNKMPYVTLLGKFFKIVLDKFIIFLCYLFHFLNAIITNSQLAIQSLKYVHWTDFIL